jgi:hypothetical protein
MTGKILVSTAYLPPVEYFAVISQAEEALIEREENYLKQSYRNRCYILSSHGPQLLTVPVYLGSQHKTPVKDIRIDYSKRWQQVHLGAIVASYGSSPYFQYYFENIEKIISRKADFLFDLNMELTYSVLKMLKLDSKITCTADFAPAGDSVNDFRYKISPKKESHYSAKEYMHVFDSDRFIHRLSIIDLIFNTGPEAIDYL